MSIDSPEGTSSLQRNFMLGVVSQCMRNPQAIESTNLAYQAGSALFAHRRDIRRLTGEPQDYFSFFKVLPTFFPDVLNSETLPVLIQQLNDHLAQHNIVFVVVEPWSNGKPGGLGFEGEVNGNHYSHPNPFVEGPRAPVALKMSTGVALSINEGGVQRELSELKEGAHVIALNGQYISQPELVLVTLGHELGHVVEEVTSTPEIHRVGERDLRMTPRTEVVSTTWGFQTAKAAYLKYQRNEYIDLAAFQMMIYDQVTKKVARR